MLHAGGAPAFLYCGPRPCAAALERCACRKAAGRACPAPTFYAGERFTPPRGVFRCHRRARSGQDRSLQTTRYRCIAGRDDRLSKKVCSPLGPLCEGAPPAGGGGENCTAVRNISGYGKVLSLRPFGAPLPLWRKRHLPPYRGSLSRRGRFFDSLKPRPESRGVIKRLYSKIDENLVFSRIGVTSVTPFPLSAIHSEG